MSDELWDAVERYAEAKADLREAEMVWDLVGLDYDELGTRSLAVKATRRKLEELL